MTLRQYLLYLIDEYNTDIYCIKVTFQAFIIDIIRPQSRVTEGGKVFDRILLECIHIGFACFAFTFSFPQLFFFVNMMGFQSFKRQQKMTKNDTIIKYIYSNSER